MLVDAFPRDSSIPERFDWKTLERKSKCGDEVCWPSEEGHDPDRYTKYWTHEDSPVEKKDSRFDKRDSCAFKLEINE